MFFSSTRDCDRSHRLFDHHFPHRRLGHNLPPQTLQRTGESQRQIQVRGDFVWKKLLPRKFSDEILFARKHVEKRLEKLFLKRISLRQFCKENWKKTMFQFFFKLTEITKCKNSKRIFPQFKKWLCYNTAGEFQNLI
jgi:hypothetical protein